jgi:hypothetical protein
VILSQLLEGSETAEQGRNRVGDKLSPTVLQTYS